ncbi:MAG: ComF family protein [Clostridia bacterium]|nr:ComF family protein [Clostridia bacterium]
MNLFNKALDFIFPPVCGICGKIAENYLCKECKDKLALIVKSTYDEKCFHFWLYKYDDIRSLILRYKFNECSYLYITISELILYDEKARAILNKSDYIISVPIHKRRRYERGYNQCELIAKRLSDKTENLEYLSNVLAKKKNIVPQSTLSKEDRINNIRDAFYIKNRIDLTNKTVILLDDIYTTGSTVGECIKVLKTLNYKSIYVFTIAKK